MTDSDTFKDQPKQRKAKIIKKPPNPIKKKIGSGGIDKELLIKAEEVLENSITALDFKPIANELLNDLDKAVQAAKKTPEHTEATIEAILYPAAQFKAQGTMFHFPLISDIADILINFLETVILPISDDAMEIIAAHRKAITVVIHTNMMDRNHPQGAELKRSLQEACERYYKLLKP